MNEFPQSYRPVLELAEQGFLLSDVPDDLAAVLERCRKRRLLKLKKEQVPDELIRTKQKRVSSLQPGEWIQTGRGDGSRVLGVSNLNSVMTSYSVEGAVYSVPSSRQVTVFIGKPPGDYRERLALAPDGQDALDLLREVSQSKATDPAESTPDSDPEFEFRQDGNGYFISAFGESGHFKELKGFDDIYKLLSSRTGAVSMRNLFGWSANVSSQNKQELSHEFDDTEYGSSEKPDVTLDAEYIQDLKREANELAEEVKSEADEAARARMQEDLDKVTDKLRKGVGIRGKGRNLDAEVDGLRPAISRRLNTAYQKMEGSMPKTAAHLKQAISADGWEFRYAPAVNTPDWKL